MRDAQNARRADISKTECRCDTIGYYIVSESQVAKVSQQEDTEQQKFVEHLFPWVRLFFGSW
jgi:TorA maturation chaperone TorD